MDSSLKMNNLFIVPFSTMKEHFFLLLTCIPTPTFIFIFQFRNTGRGLLGSKKKPSFQTIDLSILACQILATKRPRESPKIIAFLYLFRYTFKVVCSRRQEGEETCSEDLVPLSSILPLGSLLNVSSSILESLFHFFFCCHSSCHLLHSGSLGCKLRP